MTDHFTNTTINIDEIPKIEEVIYTFIQKKYWKVIVINLLITFFVFAVIILSGYYFIEDFTPTQLSSVFIVYIILFIISFVSSKISFKKKKYAFREHDVLFQNGVIATTLTIVPYNRIQHVALDEGWISRIFKLATIKMYTASGSSGDISIPGIEKDKAEEIKFLLMGKIKNEL